MTENRSLSILSITDEIRLPTDASAGVLTLQDINADDDSDGDGISNLDEYLAGTYAFDPADGFTLQLVGIDSGTTVLEFLTLRGRTYSIYGSSNLKNWVSRPCTRCVQP